MVSLDVASIRAPLASYLATELGLLLEEAELTVDHFIRADQLGKEDHGLARIHYLVSSGKFGPYRGVPAPEVQRQGPGRIHVDGCRHLGYPVLKYFIEAGCEEARRHGTCVGTSVSVYPSGALCDWAHLAIAHGVGTVLMASSPPRVTSPKGRRPRIGTNPICIGVPTEPIPFVADAATSGINHGELLLARSSGSPLPKNSAVDSDGLPTTRADQVDPTRGQGALLPVGRSHKAFALGMGIELLVSLGGGLPGDNNSRQHGVFCLFVGPTLIDETRAAISTWLDHLDTEGTRIPGWESYRRAEKQRHHGFVELRPDTVRQLESLLDRPLSISTTCTHEQDDPIPSATC